MTREQKAAHNRLQTKLHRFIYRKLTAEPDNSYKNTRPKNPLFVEIENLLDETKGTSIQRIANKLSLEKSHAIRLMDELVREKRIRNLSAKGKVGMFVVLRQNLPWGH